MYNYSIAHAHARYVLKLVSSCNQKHCKSAADLRASTVTSPRQKLKKWSMISGQANVGLLRSPWCRPPLHALQCEALLVRAPLMFAALRSSHHVSVSCCCYTSRLLIRSGLRGHLWPVALVLSEPALLPDPSSGVLSKEGALHQHHT